MDYQNETRAENFPPVATIEPAVRENKNIENFSFVIYAEWLLMDFYMRLFRHSNEFYSYHVSVYKQLEL